MSDHESQLGAARLALVILSASIEGRSSIFSFNGGPSLTFDQAIEYLATSVAKPVLCTGRMEDEGIAVSLRARPPQDDSWMLRGWTQFLDEASAAGAPNQHLLFKAPSLQAVVTSADLAVFIREYSVPHSTSCNCYDEEARRAGVAAVVHIGPPPEVEWETRDWERDP